MNPFEYVQMMDIVAAIAIFFLVYNLLVMTTKLVQVHGLIASKRGYSFSATANVYVIAACTMLIYWHLFVPGPN